MAADEPSIGARTVRGMYWAYGSFVAGRSLTLVSTAVLAHLLDPRDFGLVALALVFTALLETVADLGIAQALVITREEEVLERADTVSSSAVNTSAKATSPKSRGSRRWARTAVETSVRDRPATNEPYAQYIPRTVRAPMLGSSAAIGRERYGLPGRS